MFRAVVNTKQSFIEPSHPYGKLPFEIGETIFVKETFDPKMEFEDELRNNLTSNNLAYKADFDKNDYYLGNWKSPVHMKQEHSRLTLRITSVKVERLQDISEEDAVKEGIIACRVFYKNSYASQKGSQQWFETAREAFSELWNSTHKKQEEKFGANPWVWCFNYEVIK